MFLKTLVIIVRLLATLFSPNSDTEVTHVYPPNNCVRKDMKQLHEMFNLDVTLLINM